MNKIDYHLKTRNFKKAEDSELRSRQVFTFFITVSPTAKSQNINQAPRLYSSHRIVNDIHITRNVILWNTLLLMRWIIFATCKTLEPLGHAVNACCAWDLSNLHANWCCCWVEMVYWRKSWPKYFKLSNQFVKLLRLLIDVDVYVSNSIKCVPSSFHLKLWINFAI